MSLYNKLKIIRNENVQEDLSQEKINQYTIIDKIEGLKKLKEKQKVLINRGQTNTNDVANILKENIPNKKRKGAFDLNDLRANLPQRCFEKNLIISLFYLFFDFSILCIGWYFFSFFMKSAILLIIWEIIMGFFYCSLFVVGNDCGHGSFSNYPLLNDICGLFAHGLLLVPFSSWKHSHLDHHMNHNNVEKDLSHIWLVKHEGFIYSPKFKYNKTSETKKYSFIEQIKIPLGLNFLYGIFHFITFHYYLVFENFDFPHYWPFYRTDDLFSFISTLLAFFFTGKLLFFNLPFP